MSILSSAQQRLWVLEQFNRCRYLYHVPLALEFPYPLNLKQLHQAFINLIKQQSQLAIFFVENQNKVTQRYAEELNFEIHLINLETKLDTILKTTSNIELLNFFTRPFELNRPPLFRVAIGKNGSKNYLLICCHHLIIDAWSAGLLIQQLGANYAQLISNNNDSNQIQSHLSYSDYVSWEQQQLRENKFFHRLEYWQQRLANNPWQVDLVTDYNRPKQLSGVGDNIVIPVPAALHQSLINYAKKNHVSMNHIILATFQLFLSRYSGQDLITLGIPIMGRNQKDWHQIIGLFVNTCVHSCSLDYTNSFIIHLNNTKKQLVQDLINADIPYDFLLKQLYYNKLCMPGSSFNVLYNYIQVSQIYFGTWPCELLYCLLPVSKFDLSLHVFAETDKLNLIFEFSTELFCKDTIYQFADYLLNLLQIAMTNDHKPLSELSLVGLAKCI